MQTNYTTHDDIRQTCVVYYLSNSEARTIAQIAFRAHSRLAQGTNCILYSGTYIKCSQYSASV